MAFNISKVFYTQAQAAERLGVERHTIWRWINEGKLKGQRAGGVMFVEKKAIEKLKNTQEENQ